MKWGILLIFLLVLISLSNVNAKLNTTYKTENLILDFNFTSYEDCKKENNWVSLTDEIKIDLVKYSGRKTTCKKINYFVKKPDSKVFCDSERLEDSVYSKFCFDRTFKDFLYQACNKQLNNNYDGYFEVDIKLEETIFENNFKENISFNFTIYEEQEIKDKCNIWKKGIFGILIKIGVIILTVILFICNYFIFKMRRIKIKHKFLITGIIDFLFIILMLIGLGIYYVKW